MLKINPISSDKTYNTPVLSFSKKTAERTKIKLETGLEEEPVIIVSVPVKQIAKKTEKRKPEHDKTPYIIAGIGAAAVLGVSGLYLGTIRKYENQLFNEMSKRTRKYVSGLIPKLEGKAEAFTVKTSDNVDISCLKINPSKSNKFVIFCNGSGCGKTTKQYQEAFSQFSDAGYGVIAFDYRGMGQSTGKFSEKGVYKDIEAIFENLKASGVPEENIGLVGHSMGTGITIDFASKHKTAFNLLINPFKKASELAGIAVDFIKMPDAMKKGIRSIPEYLLPLQNSFNSGKNIKKITSPTLIIHSTDDSAIPVKMAQELSKMGNKNTSYIELSGGNHDVNADKISECITFLNKLFSPAS